MHTLKKKIDDKFCKIDKLVGVNGGFKMEWRFKNEIKDLICDIWMISRKKPWYIKAIRKESERGQNFDNSEIDQLLSEGRINKK